MSPMHQLQLSQNGKSYPFPSHAVSISHSNYFHSCTRISELLLGNCVLLTDEAAQQIGEHLHALETLDLSSCLLLTDLAPVCRGAPRMRAITLAGCENVTDASIAGIARLPHLRVLHLVGCKRITDAALSHFASAAPSLRR